MSMRINQILKLKLLLLTFLNIFFRLIKFNSFGNKSTNAADIAKKKLTKPCVIKIVKWNKRPNINKNILVKIFLFFN